MKVIFSGRQYGHDVAANAAHVILGSIKTWGSFYGENEFLLVLLFFPGHLQYQEFWRPCFRKFIDKLDNIQKRVTRMVKGSSVSAMEGTLEGILSNLLIFANEEIEVMSYKEIREFSLEKRTLIPRGTQLSLSI